MMPLYIYATVDGKTTQQENHVNICRFPYEMKQTKPVLMLPLRLRGFSVM